MPNIIYALLILACICSLGNHRLPAAWAGDSH